MFTCGLGGAQYGKKIEDELNIRYYNCWLANNLIFFYQWRDFTCYVPVCERQHHDVIFLVAHSHGEQRGVNFGHFLNPSGSVFVFSFAFRSAWTCLYFIVDVGLEPSLSKCWKRKVNRKLFVFTINWQGYFCLSLAAGEKKESEFSNYSWWQDDLEFRIALEEKNSILRR